MTVDINDDDIEDHSDGLTDHICPKAHTLRSINNHEEKEDHPKEDVVKQSSLDTSFD